jgi:hypothetical protein
VIGQTCAGLDEARLMVHVRAERIADELLRGIVADTWTLDRYRDACTDLRDMQATNSELCPGGEAWAVFGGAS